MDNRAVRNLAALGAENERMMATAHAEIAAAVERERRLQQSLARASSRAPSVAELRMHFERREVREVLGHAARLRRRAIDAAMAPTTPANGGRLFYSEDDPIEVSDVETVSDAEFEAPEHEAVDGARTDRDALLRTSRSGWAPAAHMAARSLRPAPRYQQRIKDQLRVVQERLDAEIVGASLSEGAYLDIMNAVKTIWETVDLAFVVV